MRNTSSGTETRERSREVRTPDGRCIGVLVPTPEDDEGTYELTITPEISRSLCSYVASTLEATPGGDTSDVWRDLGFHPAAHSLLRHLAMHRHGSSEDENVRLFTIDESAHGPCDDAIAGIATALTRIEQFRRDTSAADGHQL